MADRNDPKTPNYHSLYHANSHDTNGDYRPTEAEQDIVGGFEHNPDLDFMRFYNNVFANKALQTYASPGLNMTPGYKAPSLMDLGKRYGGL